MNLGGRPDAPPPLSFFATAAKGTEVALRDELRELRFRKVRADRGGVHFEGDFTEGARACLELRIAMRVLLSVGDFDAPAADALYEGVRQIDWSRFVTPRHTIAVRAASHASALTHTQYVAQKTKDAVVDQLRDAVGARPSVDVEDPDVLLFVRLAHDRATVYADLSGEPLHRRGYRKRATTAPLKETLAAAILRLGGWDRQRPLLDPMCGSGTIAIEAALWARGIAPGLSRPRFGFERWASHDAAAQKTIGDLRRAVRDKAQSAAARVIACDIDDDALAVAREAARQAGVRIVFERRPLARTEALDPPGHLVTNPPYGERLIGAAGLYRELGDVVRRLRGHRVSILAGTPEIADAMRLRPTSVHAVYNGAIECRLLTYDVR